MLMTTPGSLVLPQYALSACNANNVQSNSASSEEDIILSHTPLQYNAICVITRCADSKHRRANERERENKFETPSARSDLCHSSRWSQHPTVVYNVRLSTENEMRRKLRRQNSQRCLDGTAHDDSMNNADIFQHHPHTHRERHIANVDAMELLLRHFVALDPFVRRQPDSIPIDTR